MEPRLPVSRGIDLTPEVLASQGRALRGLARSLLADAHAAEDVEQETWLACLRHPGVVPVRFSAWLGTVAKRLALRRKRGEERRHAREERAAASERGVDAAVRGLERGLEREEALRSVTQALLALDEPFKSALLLRYYEDRTPSEIAAELGLPLATVKSRLARGLEKLRARLGAEFGDEGRLTRALFVLAALRPTGVDLSPPATTPLETLTMGLKVQGAVAVLALAGGALFLWDRSSREPRAALPLGVEQRLSAHTLDPRPDAGESTAAMLAPARVEAERTAVAPEALAPEPMATLPAEPAFLYRLEGQVRDARDLPLAGARVYLAPRRFPLNRVAMTDAEGRFALEFEARRPTMNAAFLVDDGGAGSLGLRELQLVAGRSLTLDIGLASRAERLIGSAVSMQLSLRSGDNGIFHVVNSWRSTALDGVPEAQRTANGRLVFVDPPPQESCARLAEEPAEIVQVAGQPLVGALQLTLLGGIQCVTENVSVTDAAPEPAPTASVRGTLRAADGAPLAGLEVGWGPPGQTLTSWTSSDEHGAYALEDVPAGEWRLRAGGGDDGHASELVTLAGGERRAWNPLVERGDEVRGRVRLSSGEALANLRLELWSAGSDLVWCDSTATNEDGFFAFPNVPAGPLELHVHGIGEPTPASVFPVRVLAPLFGPSELGEIVIGPADLRTHALAMTLLDARGEPLQNAEVRLWHVTTGRGTFVRGPDDDGKHRLAGLPTGEYRVEAGSPLGWRELGALFLEADLDLGLERFEAPGAVRVHLQNSSRETRLHGTLWSAHRDVFGQVGERTIVVGPGAGLEFLLGLRAGDYALGMRAEQGERLELPLAVLGGSAPRVRLHLEDSGLRAEPLERASATVLAPELEAQLRAQSCGACHVRPGG